MDCVRIASDLFASPSIGMNALRTKHKHFGGKV